MYNKINQKPSPFDFRGVKGSEASNVTLPGKIPSIKNECLLDGNKVLHF